MIKISIHSLNKNFQHMFRFKCLQAYRASDYHALFWGSPSLFNTNIIQKRLLVSCILLLCIFSPKKYKCISQLMGLKFSWTVLIHLAKSCWYLHFLMYVISHKSSIKIFVNETSIIKHWPVIHFCDYLSSRISDCVCKKLQLTHLVCRTKI